RGIAAAAFVAALAGGCDRPPDEVWLRFLGFGADAASITLVEGKLRDGTTNGADALFENASASVGTTGGGTGVFIDRARVEYRMSGFAPPAFEYPVSLYLPAPGDAASKGTLKNLPLAPVGLKRWLIDTGAFADATTVPSLALQARVSFFAVTDEGLRLETGGGISVVLANAQ
ncbi:MAG TPA: hypothetical protein VN317_09365, partial [Candidatus Methanoperedens sp.]|nr:hypothetical protein [Candidatus Methanoperedens sp.]